MKIEYRLLQAALAERLRGLGLLSDEYVAATALALAEVFTKELVRRTGVYVAIELDFAPLIMSYLVHTGSRELDRAFLDRIAPDLEALISKFAKQSPDSVSEVAALPSVRFLIQQLRLHGSKEQRSRFRKLISRAAAGEGGRPPKMFEEMRCVLDYQDYERERSRLDAGFTRARELKRAGGWKSDIEHIKTELRKMDQKYDGDEIDGIVNARTLSGAAIRLVALRRNMTPRAISVSVRRGKVSLTESANRTQVVIR